MYVVPEFPYPALQMQSIGLPTQQTNAWSSGVRRCLSNPPSEMCLMGLCAELLGRPGREVVSVPRNKSLLLLVALSNLNSYNVHGSVDRAQRFPEQFKGAVSLEASLCALERRKQPIKNTGTHNNAVRYHRHDLDASFCQHPGNVLGKRGDERTSEACHGIGHNRTLSLCGVPSRHAEHWGSMRKYILALLAMTLLLTACRIESNLLLDINEDGSATINAEIGFDEEMLNLVNAGLGDPSEILGALPDFGGINADPTTRMDGDMTYFGVSTQVDDLTSYDFAGFQGETLTEFSYAFNATSATLAAKVEVEGLDDFGGGDLPDFPLDISQLTGDIFSANLVVTMPGTVTEHNADEVRGDGALVWNLPISGTVDIFATSRFGDSPANWIWIVVAVVVLVGVAATAAAIVMSKKEPEKAVTAAADAYQESEGAQHGSDHDENASSDEPDESTGDPEPAS